LNAAVTPYDRAAVSVLAEAWSWHPTGNGGSLDPQSPSRQQVSASDRIIEALVIRLDDDEWISMSNAGSYRHLLVGMLYQAQSAVSGFSLTSHLTKSVAVKPAASPARGSPEALLKLVDKWLAEEDSYDTDAWPVIQQDIEENRLSERSRFYG